MDDRKAPNGNGFSRSFRPKFSKHVEFIAMGFKPYEQVTTVMGFAGIRRDMVLIAKHHNGNSSRAVLGIDCTTDGYLNVKLCVDHSRESTPIDFTAIAL